DHDPGPRAKIRLSLRQSGRSGRGASGSAQGLRRSSGQCDTMAFGSNEADMEKPPIVYDDFAKVDIRVGRILAARPFARAKPVLQGRGRLRPARTEMVE